MSYSEYRSACMHAAKNNRALRGNNFKRIATVRHMDGSMFILQSALLELYKNRFLIAYSEHNAPITFFVEDLSYAGYGRGLKALDLPVLPGTYVYIGYNPKYTSSTPPLMVGKTDDINKVKESLNILYAERMQSSEDAETVLKSLKGTSRKKKMKIIAHFNGQDE